MPTVTQAYQPVSTLTDVHRIASVTDVVHVWLIDLTASVELCDRLEVTLQPSEQQRAARFIRPLHRQRFIESHAATTRLLAHYTRQAPRALHYHYGQHGKPALSAQSSHIGLQFNLSHAGNQALLALYCNHQIGVDIEYCKSGVRCLEIAERFFTPTETEWLAAHPIADVPGAFFRLWVRKESIIKATGAGLQQGLNTFECGAGQAYSVQTVARADSTEHYYGCLNLPAPHDYKAAFAVGHHSPDSPMPEVKLYHWRGVLI